MKMWDQLILMMVAIVSILILINLAIKSFDIPMFGQKKIEGHKDFVIKYILKLAYKCHENNRDRRESVICKEITFISDEEITQSDILDNADLSKIDIEALQVNDIGSSGEIIIRHENQMVYIEKL